MMKRGIHWFLFVALIMAFFVQPGRAAYANDCLAAVDAPGCKYGLPAGEYDALLPVMEANPAPAVARAPGVEQKELRRWSLWRLDRKGVTFYDAPGGSPVSTEDPGFSVVSPKNKTEGWVEIEPGKWVQEDNLSGLRASSFTGVLLGGFPGIPMGWLLQGTKPSQLPGKLPLKSTPTMGHYTLVNIFATVKVGEWDWYLIGPGKWVHQKRVGRLIPTAAQSTGRWVAIDLYEQVLTAYEGGTPVFATLISSGVNKYPTGEGMHKVWAKMQYDGMSGMMGKPDQYNIPSVPYVMYFNGSQALHGSFWHNSYGFKQSKGCVNMTIGDAKWMFDWVEIGTPVFVWRSR